MRVEFDEKGALLMDAGHFEPRHIFECGQCFRFVPDGGGYTGVAHGRMLHVKKNGDTVRLWPCTEAEFARIWHEYFDLGTDYEALLSALPKDPFLEAALACGHGLRVLCQPPFETLVSFILSSNNNIGRIRGLVERLCEAYGAPVGEGLHAFPAPGALAAATESELRRLGTGYRAPFVLSAARAVADGFDLNSLRSLPYEMAKKALQAIDGVGPKVADCVLLFSLGHRCAFVQDVWIKKVLREVYEAPDGAAENRRFVRARFGETGGIVQQYLFHYARSLKKLPEQAGRNVKGS